MKPIPGVVYNSPYTFTFKQRLLLRAGPPVLALCLKALLGTCRVEVRRREVIEQATSGGGHAILAFWHESFALAFYVFRNTGYHGLASYSFDGEMGARVMRRLGVFAVRGSSSRGGAEAVANMQKALEHVPCVGLTPDGPRGPWREAKPGVGIISARSGAPVIPIGFAARPAWRLGSWDRMPVPKPRARVIVQFGEIIAAPAEDTPEQVEQMRRRVQVGLNAVQRQAEAELG